jgi:hypothetical protein
VISRLQTGNSLLLIPDETNPASLKKRPSWPRGG